jgi:biotin carboxylase
MNFVYLSPHFPPHHYQFCVQLARLGVNVLGLADEPHQQLRPELKAALREYYRVGDLHNYDQLLRACGHFTHQHGRLDRLDSHSEYWMETEARLRTDFNVPGLKIAEVGEIKRKSRMKERFRRAGVPVARGAVVRTLEEGRRLAAEVGYPIVAKPDIGVGAAGTWRIDGDVDLASFFAREPPVDYILEEFVPGRLFSFDGLTDQGGNIVFFTSHGYSRGIMEVVNQDEDIFYYSLRDIPADAEEVGRRAVRAFDVRERFFHFEFFRTEGEDRIVALEINVRPPGGLIIDMINYANDIDIYREWASVVVHDRFTATCTRPYHCGCANRKYRKRYAHSHQEILARFGHLIPQHEPVSPVFRVALGDYCYVVRSPDLDELFAVARYIQE